MLLPPESLIINGIVLILTFVVLTKSANSMVDGAVGIAYKFDIPKIFIGVVLVGFGTTTPEFIVSLISALRGNPEIALGNALGSIAADDGVALALGILVAPSIIVIPKRFLRTTGVFLVAVALMSYFLARNGEISRTAGIIHLSVLVIYLIVVLRSEQKRRARGGDHLIEEEDAEIADHMMEGTTGKQITFFLIGLAGVIVASHFLVEAAVNIAMVMSVPKIVIGMTMVAIGTSLPEIATCVAAARKGHGDLAFGDVIGADILNLLWIIGAAATAKPILVPESTISFAYPATLLFIFGILFMARLGYRLHRWKAIVLLLGYALYLTLLIIQLGRGPKPTAEAEKGPQTRETVPVGIKSSPPP